MTHAWAGSAEEFLDNPVDKLLERLSEHHRSSAKQSPSAQSLGAWKEMHPVLAAALKDLVVRRADAAGWGMVLEYELPLEGGRRPDVVVLAGGGIAVLEFKSATLPLQADLDQAAAYARDLSEYHEPSHGRPIQPFLVLPRASFDRDARDGTVALGPTGLATALEELATDGQIDPEEWAAGDYRPLPTLIAAARRIFDHEPLPRVRRALSAGVHEAVEAIAEAVTRAREEDRKVLALVTGVPGSGKTLVGLRAVYEGSGLNGDATFLSGNGPLVRVLQDVLKSRAFVRDLHAFIKTYGLSERTPPQRLIVFDEAQRAWDRKYMKVKKEVESSEPDLLIRAAERIDGWAVLVGLVGEGQEIYSGEQAGLGQWRDALLEHGSAGWQVHCPPSLDSMFEALGPKKDDRLNLTVSLRSRTAEDLHEWVRRLLEGSLPLAAQLTERISRRDFPMWVTRDLDAARSYVQQRYDEEPEGLYGLLMSSHSKSGKELGLEVGWFIMNRLNIARWFNAGSDDPYSGRQLTQPITEFQCQGLELDLPILVWGNDLLWEGEGWRRKPKRSKYDQEDPEQLLQNAYRVLLTRGRDGLVVVVPPGREYDKTETALRAAGLQALVVEAETSARAAEEEEQYRKESNGL